MSDPARWSRARSLFHQASALAAEQRASWLDRECADDPALREEVESLLEWDTASTGFLDTPVARLADLPMPASEDRLVGQRLGPWLISEAIAGGGMGTVYRAERADAAYRKPAAVKVVRRGSGSAAMVDRFMRERETLAALDHPNIARLLDAGSTADGQPYLVMELVDGVRIDAYCDAQRLPLRERIALFLTVCAAVQYAHQSLVVHRDIKPDNIMVSHDGTVKLLDFGVAKLLAPGDFVADRDDAAATLLMTPEYASPEQLAGRPVTTAADVYSLGILLHVLLTGRRPYTLTGATLEQVRAQLDAVAPPRPSGLVADGSPEAGDAAARRGTTPHELAHRLAGDLDAIILRAIGRDVSSRYASVQQLADDLERYGTGHPVLARGRSVGYAAAKFVSRHRLALAAATVLLVLGAGAIAGIVWQARAAAEARAVAERRFDDVRRLANTFMFSVHDAIVNVPGTTEARALMVRTAVEYLDVLARQDTGDAGLRRELAAGFVKVGDAQGHPTSANIGDTAGARASYLRAIEIADALLRQAPGDREASRTLALAHRRLADVLAWSGDTPAALTHAETSRSIFIALGGQASASVDDALQAAIAEIKLGDLLGNPNFPNLGRGADAMARYQIALVALRRLDVGPATDQRVRRYLGITLERLGTMHETDERWHEAESAYQESFEIRRALAATSPYHADIQRDYAIAFEKLGNVQRGAGNLAAAVASYRGALGQFERLAAADPSNAIATRSVAISQQKLASTLLAARDRAGAQALLDQARATHDALAARDPNSAQARCDGARAAEDAGDAAAGDARQPPPAACAAWRASLRGWEWLQSRGTKSCGGDGTADLGRVREKLARCG